MYFNLDEAHIGPCAFHYTFSKLMRWNGWMPLGLGMGARAHGVSDGPRRARHSPGVSLAARPLPVALAF